MEVTKQGKLSFKGVEILNLEFSTKSPRSEEMEISVECEPVAFISKNNNENFQILMDVRVFNEDYFSINLQALGAFKIKDNPDPELRKNFINVNAAAIMFPYVRSFITTLTANLGRSVGTLVLPPQFFKGEIEIKEID